MDQLVKLRLYIHNDGLRHVLIIPAVHFLRRVIRIRTRRIILDLFISRSVVAPCQKHSFQRTDIRIQLGRNRPAQVKHLRRADILFRNHRIAFLIIGIVRQHLPVRCIETGLGIRIQLHLVHQAAFDKIHVLEPDAHIAGRILLIADITQLRQLIKKQIPAVTQIVGMFLAGLDGYDPLVEILDLLRIFIDIVNFLDYRPVQIVLILAQAGINS